MRSFSPAGSRRWLPQLAAALAFAALCSTVTYWALQLLGPRVAIAPAGSIVDSKHAPDLATASRLLGVPPSVADAERAATASNIQVVGLIASPLRASALMSIDGKPAKMFVAGEKIHDGATLIEVRSDTIVVEQIGGRIELPGPARPDLALLSSGADASGVNTDDSTAPPAAPSARVGTPAARASVPPYGAAAALPASTPRTGQSLSDSLRSEGARGGAVRTGKPRQARAGQANP